MKIEHEHNLETEEAYKRIDNLLNELQQKYNDKIKNPKKSWNSNNDQMDYSMEIMGFKTKGQVYLKDGEVVLDGKLPFLAKPFSGKIESIIKEQLDDLLKS